MGENLLGTRLEKCETRLDGHDRDITDIKISTGKFEAKLDITNRILGAIALMLLSGIGGLFFQALSR